MTSSSMNGSVTNFCCNDMDGRFYSVESSENQNHIRKSESPLIKSQKAFKEIQDGGQTASQVFDIIFGIGTASLIFISSIFLWVALPYLLGLLLWPIIEYSVHRWIFHLKPPDSSPWLITVHFSLHGLHHKVPFDDRRLLLPPVPAAVLLSIAYFIYSYLFSYWSTPLVMAGTITGYTMYDLMHFYLHYGSPKEGSYLYTMKRYHNQHHFAHHEEGFGISNNVLDKIFGTLIHLKKLNRTLVW